MSGDEHEILPPERAVVVYDVKPTGRPSSFTQELADEICARIAAGDSVKTICMDPGMPGLRTVMEWRRTKPIFQLAYARAREDQADAFADEMMEIADDRSMDWVQDPDGRWVPDHDHISRSKLRIETRKWIAAKLKPQSYADRVDARISGQVTNVNVTATVALDARAMSPEQRELLRGMLLPKPAAEEDDA